MPQPITVTLDNFARAESDHMLDGLLAETGGVNRWGHRRVPTDVAHQPVIRMNRDTLYSFAVVDLAHDATLVLPDAGDRYVSAMVVSQDHYIHDIFHGPGEHRITQERTGSRYALVAVRILVDPDDPADVAAVNALQDQLALSAESAEPFTHPEYDTASLDETRQALLVLMKGLPDTRGAFGREDEVDPVRHLVATAGGWGGLPIYEAMYLNVAPSLPVGRFVLTVPPVPVDGFWSVSVYDAGGFFAVNDRNSYTVNNLTAQADADGTVTVHLGDWEPGTPNCIPLPEGWNYAVRLYRPRAEILDGSWRFPDVVAAQ